MNRTVLLRGVNLGGSSKVPTHPNGATHLREGFFQHREVSFIDRPFPIESADEHFSRLKHWGFNFLRLLTTWEAIEHEGPGIYDDDYLDYYQTIVQTAAQYGFYVLIDPHQDVWSRFSGGDGAPGWTLESVGFNLPALHETGAAFLHQLCDENYPPMIWPTNASKLAAGTMFTLFFGGNQFAPRTKIDGEPVQDFLTRHYIGALLQIARRLKGMPNVIGFDTMNEPLPGFIGWDDLSRLGGMAKRGPMPSPFQSMTLGEGIPQEVALWDAGRFGQRRTGSKIVNRKRLRAWQPGSICVWRENGVWEVDESGAPQLLRSDHFTQVRGRSVDFGRDFYRPFANRVARELHAVESTFHIFIEVEPMQQPPTWSGSDATDIVYAPHWYDGYVLYLKRFHPHVAVDSQRRRLVLGSWRISRRFRKQLRSLRETAKEKLGDVPVVIGEVGVAFDLNNRRAYRTGDFHAQVAAMDRSMRALEANLLSFALWNYTADNSNQHGDQWNREDLSIFSYDQQTNPENINSGGRALQSILRPYPRKTPGDGIYLAFDVKKRSFTFTYKHDVRSQAACEIFVPSSHYPHGYTVDVSDGSFETDPEAQLLIYHHSQESSTHTIRIHPQPAME